MIYSICDFCVEFTPKYELLCERAEKYLSDNQNATPEITLAVTEEEIDEYLRKFVATRALAEYVLMGIKFYDEIMLHGAFFLHSSALCVDGCGFAFTGPCGAGKSTHASLWRKYFGDKVISVNDDKPAVKISDGAVYICGTPFSGKHDINSNTVVPLCGICIMEQSAENAIRRLSSAEAIQVIMTQTLNSVDTNKMSALFDMLDETLSKVPVYKLSCNISFEAVELAYKTMKSGDL